LFDDPDGALWRGSPEETRGHAGESLRKFRARS
jgi:hypothetical protein